MAARQPLRAGAKRERESRRRRARRSARPRRRPASRDSADRRRAWSPADASARSAMVKGLSSRPSRSTTSVEPSRDVGKVERAEACRVALPGDGRAQARRRDERDGAAKTKTRRRRRVTPRPHPVGYADHLLPQGEGSAPSPSGRGVGGEGKGLAASLRPHLELAEGGAAVAFGIVHVLGGRRRIDVAAGGDGAHHIGDGEERRLALRAVERRDETVVAIFGMRGLDVLASARRRLRSSRRRTSAGLSISRPAGRRSTTSRRARARLRLGHFQRHHDALVLRHALQRVDLGSVELVERPLDRIAVGGGGVRLDRRARDRDDELRGVLSRIGDDDRPRRKASARSSGGRARP